MKREEAGALRNFEGMKRVVIKIGTRLLSDARFHLDKKALALVAGHVAAARKTGAQVVLVTSGAVGAGMGRLGLKKRPTSIVERQACAAVGQSLLMHEYQLLFSKKGVTTAQILLTQSDVADRKRHQNVRRVMRKLLDDGILPIVNENDVVADEELRFGDNDTLSGLVADLVDADCLIILTDVDGLYDAPRGAGSVPVHGRRISVVPTVTREVYALAGGASGVTSTGGMVTKLRAAERMARAGRVTVIASGGASGIVERIFAGDDVGTIFLPSAKTLESRKRWIAHHLIARGRIVVDAGAAEALKSGGGSLLPSGICAVEGKFGPGSAVQVVDIDGVLVGQGLAAYGADEIDAIKRLRSDRIASVLGFTRGAEVIHRNDLVVG